MTTTREDSTEAVRASRLSAFLLEKGIEGAGPLSGARDLAEEYLIDAGFKNHDERVAALVRWETRKNFTTGFLTGLGGIVTFPVSIPAALGASWLIQARMSGAIAAIYGHDLAAERVRTGVLLSLAGDVAREAMKDLGIGGSEGGLTRRALEQVPGRVLVEINKRIGVRLLASASQRVLLRFPRAVPVVGGVVGGTLDAVVCRMVGRTAQKMFKPLEHDEAAGAEKKKVSRGGSRRGR